MTSRMPERARTDVRGIMPPLSQSLDPIDPRGAGRWDREYSRDDLLARRCPFHTLAPFRSCPELPQPLSFQPIGPNDPQAPRRNLPRANPAAQRPVPELVRRHLKRLSQIRQPPLVAIELRCTNPPPGQLSTRQQLSHRGARVALSGSWRVVAFPVELHRDLLDRPTRLTHLDDSID